MGLRRLTPRNCAVCGVLFQPRKDRNRNCSQACGWTHAGGKPRHGMSQTPEYNTWVHIKRRCENPNTPFYHRYGGRGIKLCERWQVFENFFADMGLRPAHCSSIDRINNDGDYEPGNCRWATTKEQSRNTSANVRITVDGKQVGVTDLAERLGVDAKMVQQRVRHGLAEKWDLDRLFTPPPPPGECRRGHKKRMGQSGSWWCPTCDIENRRKRQAYYAGERGGE
jgi:hypothetical protein